MNTKFGFETETIVSKVLTCPGCGCRVKELQYERKTGRDAGNATVMFGCGAYGDLTERIQSVELTLKVGCLPGALKELHQAARLLNKVIKIYRNHGKRSDTLMEGMEPMVVEIAEFLKERNLIGPNKKSSTDQEGE